MRRAFTLIEILVVLALIAILAALAIYFVPSFQTSERAARGAANLQGWLNGARQRAIRDQSPRGLRILFDPVTGLASQCQYLEQPDDLGSGKFYDSAAGQWLNLQIFPSPDGLPYKIWIKSVNEQTGASAAAFNFGAGFSGDPTVQFGDSLEIDGVGLRKMIVDTEQSDKTKAVYDVLVLRSSLPEGITSPVKNFKIVRRPRPTGDETMDLPKSVIVDRNTNKFYSAIVEEFPDNLDVMFSPRGSVMGDFSKQHLVFWVRSTDEDAAPVNVPTDYFRGEPTLIVIYINSGLVAAYQVNTGNVANPYDLVK